ncbi:hypothetical protein [Levilactobacillus yonginensis]|uniref:hypothetical protein n=1 Tax=Levilactobacillus yonginensis TaxID=1054041 RepID=UPI00345DCDE0
MKWRQIPRWLRDTCSVVGAMSVLLVIYDLWFAKHVNWLLVPLQIIVAFLAVGVWSYFSARSQARRQVAEQKKAAAAKQRQAAAEQRKREAEKSAAATRERNIARNRAHQQRRK